MNGAGRSMVRLNSSDVNCVRDSSDLEAYSSIRIDLQYGMRSAIGLFIFVFSPFSEHHQVAYLVCVLDSFGVFQSVVFIDNFLFAISDVFRVRSMLDIQDHIPSED